MPQMTMIQAVNDALHVSMKQDDSVVMLGEDIGRKGGVERDFDSLRSEFSKALDRIRS